ncbi:MAG: zinc-dependent peptidase [Cytophagales bacterium]|nr:zinc-dependent peptidase [Cytophaga sp.]
MNISVIFLASYFDQFTHGEITAGTVTLALFIAPFVWFSISYFYYYFKAQQIHLSKFFQYKKPLDVERVQLLKKYIPYYTTLSSENKKVFEKRMHHFLLNKTFTSDNSIEITEDMKVMIAATAMQILFGLEAYYLSNFKNIHIVSEIEPALKHLHTSDDIRSTGVYSRRATNH